MPTSVLCSEASLHRRGRALCGAHYHVKHLACGVVGLSGRPTNVNST